MSGRLKVWFVSGCAVLSLVARESRAAGPKSTPIVSRIVVTSSSAPFAGCTPSSLQANVQAVSNDGVVGGYVTSKLGSGGCLPRVFRWNTSGYTIVPFPKMPPNTYASGGRIAVISTNNVTGGITFECQGSQTCPSPFEAATASGPTTQNVINGWNYVFGISENGTWITGTNLGGQPLLYNVPANKAVSLTLNGAAMTGASLGSVSNAGLAVGTHATSQTHIQNGMICTTAGPCQEIDKGTTTYNALLKAISTNGTYIYGWHAYGQNKNVITTAAKNGSGAWVVTETSLPYVMFPRADVTDKGTIVVTPGTGPNYYFALVGPKTTTQNYYLVYSVASVIAKLGLTGAQQNTVAMSPNGKYISFNVPVVGSASTLIGYRVYFENGIEDYLMNGGFEAVKGVGGPAKR